VSLDPGWAAVTDEGLGRPGTVTIEADVLPAERSDRSWAEADVLFVRSAEENHLLVPGQGSHRLIPDRIWRIVENPCGFHKAARLHRCARPHFHLGSASVSA
jgi:hypothetical protein